jgi:hypothetical protein
MTRKSQYWLWGAGLVAVIAVAAGAYGYAHVAPYAQIGATYIAKQDCSCLFVEGRSEASCTAEFSPDINRFRVAIDRSHLPASAKVTTRLAIFSGEATYAEGFGCAVTK